MTSLTLTEAFIGATLGSIGMAVLGIVVHRFLDELGKHRILRRINERPSSRGGASISALVLNYVLTFLIGVPILSMGRWRHFHAPSSLRELLVEGLLIPILFLQCVDTLAYVEHYASHKIRLLRKWHGEHHAAVDPLSFSMSSASDGIEWIIVTTNGVHPLLLGHVFSCFELTPLLFVAFTGWSGVAVVVNHCGWIAPKIPGLISSVEHWAHHGMLPEGLFNLCEYTTLMDHLFGTYLSHEAILDWQRRWKAAATRARSRPLDDDGVGVGRMTYSGTEILEQNEKARPHRRRPLARLPGHHGIIGAVLTAYRFLTLDVNAFFDWLSAGFAPGVPVHFRFLLFQPCAFVSDPSHAAQVFRGGEGDESGGWTFSRGSWEFFLARFRTPCRTASSRRRTRREDVSPSTRTTLTARQREAKDGRGARKTHADGPEASAELGWKELRTRTMQFMRGPYLEDAPRSCAGRSTSTACPSGVGWRGSRSQSTCATRSSSSRRSSASTGS